MKKTHFLSKGYLHMAALSLFIFAAQNGIAAQTAHTLLRKADKNYLNNDYKSAEENYTKAQLAQRTDKGDYNLANSIYQQQRYDEAGKQYGEIAAKTKDNNLKFNSLYNKGNAHFWKKEYDKSIDSYKTALRMNPKDYDAKKNLALAQRMLQQQQQQQQKDKENQDKNNKNNKKDKKDKQQQEQNQQKQDQNQDDKKEQNEQPQTQQEMKKEQARQILKIMDDEERKVQERLRKGKPKPSRSTKDW